MKKVGKTRKLFVYRPLQLDFVSQYPELPEIEQS